jgi:hypothetical protein
VHLDVRRSRLHPPRPITDGIRSSVVFTVFVMFVVPLIRAVAVVVALQRSTRS